MIKNYDTSITNEVNYYSQITAELAELSMANSIEEYTNIILVRVIDLHTNFRYIVSNLCL